MIHIKKSPTAEILVRMILIMNASQKQSSCFNIIVIGIKQKKKFFYYFKIVVSCNNFISLEVLITFLLFFFSEIHCFLIIL